MPHAQAHAHAHAARELVDVWSVEGRYTQLVYSPRGTLEGLLIDADGITTQFVFDRHDEPPAAPLLALRAGQTLVVEGSEAGPSPKGEAAHTVYDFVRLVSVDGRAVAPAPATSEVSGSVVRFNYARHGQPNGVVLDSGDFVHTRPDGFARLGLRIGDRVRAEGASRPLVSGEGRVLEATRVNGRTL